MWHIGNALLAIVDGLDNSSGQFLQQFCKLVLLLGGLAFCGACFRGGLNASIWIQTADGTVAFLQDASTFFQQWLNLIDEFFFVKFLLGRTVGFLDVL